MKSGRMKSGPMGEGSACARYASMLATFAGRSRRDASRTPAERRQFREVREHLSDCSSCRRIAGEFLQAGKALRQAAVARAQVADVPFEAMHADIMERIAVMTASDVSLASDASLHADAAAAAAGGSSDAAPSAPVPSGRMACGSQRSRLLESSQASSLASSLADPLAGRLGDRAVRGERWAMMVAAAAVLLLSGFWWSGRPSVESIWDRAPSPLLAGGQPMSAAPYSALPYSGPPAQVRPAGLEQAGGAERGIGPGMMGRGTMRWFVDVQPAVYLKLVEPADGGRELSAGELAAPSVQGPSVQGPSGQSPSASNRSTRSAAREQGRR
ncbi:MAG: hypothetical protein AB8H80_17520 [Planctomycetota bacterium]